MTRQSQKTYESTIRKLAQDADALGGFYAAQSSERWRGMVGIAAFIYYEQTYNVLDDVKKHCRNRERKN